MGRKRKSVDEIKGYKVPHLLQDKLRELINGVTMKPVTKLQFWKHLELLETIVLRRDSGNDPEGYVSLDAKIMQQTIGSTYSTIRYNLEMAGIIESLKDSLGRPLYSKYRHEAIQYRLTDTFRHDEIGEIKGAKRVFKNKPKKPIIERNTRRLLTDICGFPEYSLLQRWLHELTFDIESFEREALVWIEEGWLVRGKKYDEIRHKKYLNKCNAINRDDVMFYIGYGNRVFSHLTGLSRAAKKHIGIIGYEGVLYQLDLISAHILLAVPRMRDYQSELTDTRARKELDNIIEMIGSKKFYQVISDKIRGEGVIIKDEKGEFLKQVWNSVEFEYQVKTPYRKAFNKLFPTFNTFIVNQKNEKDGHRKFAKALTQLESHLFNNRIAHRVAVELGMETCLLGIFDAFVCKEEDWRAVETIMEEEIVNLTGIAGMVKTTTLKEESDKVIARPSRILNVAKVSFAEPHLVKQKELPSTSLNMELVNKEVGTLGFRNYTSPNLDFSQWKEVKVPIDTSTMTDDEFMAFLNSDNNITPTFDQLLGL